MKSGFSVFIPVLNEQAIIEANTRRLLAYLRTLGRPFELIIGSNGSTDTTPDLGRKLAAEEPEVVFFHLPQRAPGLAFARAAEMARYESIVTQDMDLSVDLEFIPRAVELLERCQVVIGSKRMGEQARSWYRIVGSGAYILTVRLMLGLGYRDYSLAAKGYHKSVVERFGDWIDPGTAYVINLVYWARRAGLAVVETPVVCRDDRPSRFNLLEEAITRFARLGRLWWAIRTGRPPRWGKWIF